MKVMVIGASGIIGQHMRLCQPPDVRAVYYRRRSDYLHSGLDICDHQTVEAFIRLEAPAAVVNLAGENSPDVVERDGTRSRMVNVEAAVNLAKLCQERGIRYVHVSSQAALDPVNEYGRQKASTDAQVMPLGGVILRPTFVLGIRPFPGVGRQNPAEQMLLGVRPQVNDRFFSPSFAPDVAAAVWKYSRTGAPGGIRPLGLPMRCTRYGIARALGMPAEPVSHADFAGLAPRPADTTYTDGEHLSSFEHGIGDLIRHWNSRQAAGLEARAREIAAFFRITEDQAAARLRCGFQPAHAHAAEDFRRAAPKDNAGLLDWYRKTEAYVWELSAFHLDKGFNYEGMWRGIAGRLYDSGARQVLCLGDGIGDGARALHIAGIDPVYHDLAGSTTANFALFRAWVHGRTLKTRLTTGWEPELGGPYDAVVSIDFLEHVPNVAEWVRAIKAAIRPGGFLVAQNAFGCGSGPHGSIPMHLTVNDRYEFEWSSLMAAEGFRLEGDIWWRRC